MKKTVLFFHHILLMIFIVKYSPCCNGHDCDSTTFDYPMFYSTANLNYIQEAKVLNNYIRLTPAVNDKKGAVWYKDKINVSKGFETIFSFRLTNGGQFSYQIPYQKGTTPGGDGLAFVIQNYSESAIGIWAGAGIGYHNIKNSIAIEFDRWFNKDLSDPNANHIAVQSAGIDTNTIRHDENCLALAKDIVDLRSDGTIYYCKVEYSSINKTLLIYLDTTGIFEQTVLVIKDFQLEKIISLDYGKAFVGFTASTGGAWENHDILSWSYCSFIKEEDGLPCNNDGLIAYWGFDDSTANDHSGNGFHGQLKNTPQPVSGVRGTGIAMRFKSNGGFANNGGDHIILPMIDFKKYDEFSITLWVKEESMVHYDGEGYIFFGNHWNGWCGIGHFWGESLFFSVGGRYYHNDNCIIAEFKESFLNNWVFYCLTYSNGILKAYINSVLIGTLTTEINIYGDSACMSKHWWDNGKLSTRFTGSIDEVKIWCKALNDIEIMQEYRECDETAFDFPLFDSTSNITFVGTATTKKNAVNIASKGGSGAAWCPEKISVKDGFETDFSFIITEPGSIWGDNYCGDGFSFTLQNSNPTAIGGGGGGIGFAGIENSIAIEFDFYKNSEYSDPSSRHISIQTAGKGINHCIHSSLYTLGYKDIEMKHNIKYFVKILYENERNRMSIYLSESDKFSQPIIEVNSLKLDSILDLDKGKCYLGFTASTGNAWQNHDILSWSVCPFEDCSEYNVDILTNKHAICEGDSIILSTSEKYQSYQWSTGDTSATICAKNQGNYYVNVLDTNGCLGTDTIFIKVYPKPEVSIQKLGPDVLCEGDSFILRAIPDLKGNEYLWSTGETTPSIIIRESGKYFVKIINENGCSSFSDTSTIYFNSNQLSILGYSESSKIVFDSTYLMELNCKTISLQNKSENTVFIEDVYLFRNIEFSIPQSQLPIIIMPKDTLSIIFCYSPLDTGQHRDTISIIDTCLNLKIPLSGIGIGEFYSGSSKCGTPIKLKVVANKYKKYKIYPISPNPFSESTTINYELQTPGRVKIDIYNSLGEKITTLVDKWQEAGKHNAIFNLGANGYSPVQSGMYYYRIQIGDRIESGKMVLIR